MTDRQWLDGYFDLYRTAIFADGARPGIITLRDLVKGTHEAGRRVWFAGNGGSAGIAAHCAVDFAKAAGVRANCFNEPGLITCLANDFGYDRWMEQALRLHAEAGDLVVLISSSGRSPNVVAAARYARSRGMTVVTLTGFAPDNPLRGEGDLNLWVDSRAYNVVEMTHHIWLVAACDLLIGEAEYPAVRPSQAT